MSAWSDSMAPEWDVRNATANALRSGWSGGLHALDVPWPPCLSTPFSATLNHGFGRPKRGPAFSLLFSRLQLASAGANSMKLGSSANGVSGRSSSLTSNSTRTSRSTSQLPTSLRHSLETSRSFSTIRSRAVQCRRRKVKNGRSTGLRDVLQKGSQACRPGRRSGHLIDLTNHRGDQGQLRDAYTATATYSSEVTGKAYTDTYRLTSACTGVGSGSPRRSFMRSTPAGKDCKGDREVVTLRRWTTDT
jgi:hypothetical protein